MNYFSVVLEQIGIFVVYALIGVIAVKAHVLDRKGLNILSGFITKIALPLLIFTNTVNGSTRRQFVASLSILVIAAVLYITLFLVATLLAKIMHMSGSRGNVYRACTMFGNCGFMGIPIVTALFPERGGLYIAIYTVVDQLMLWTVGMNLTAPSEGNEKISAGQRIRKMINPATVGVLLGVIFILAGIHLPDFLSTALTKTGASATPLAMIYLGGVFCYINMADYLKKWEIYVTIAVKMILLPLLVFAILSHIPAVTQEIAVTISILCSLPTMSSVAMVAESQHSDSDYAAGMIFVTTLFSIVTVPVVCMLL